jgi:hypothetical protein
MRVMRKTPARRSAVTVRLWEEVMGDRPLRPDSSLPGRPAGALRPRRGRRGLRSQLSGHDRGAVLARLASACHLERSQGRDGGHHLRLRALPGIASATAQPGLFVEDSATTRVGTPSGIESPWKLPERRASVDRSRREGAVDIGEPERAYTVEPLEDPVPREPLEPPDGCHTPLPGGGTRLAFRGRVRGLSSVSRSPGPASHGASVTADG